MSRMSRMRKPMFMILLSRDESREIVTVVCENRVLLPPTPWADFNYNEMCRNVGASHFVYTQITDTGMYNVHDFSNEQTHWGMEIDISEYVTHIPTLENMQ